MAWQNPIPAAAAATTPLPAVGTEAHESIPSCRTIRSICERTGRNLCKGTCELKQAALLGDGASIAHLLELNRSYALTDNLSGVTCHSARSLTKSTPNASRIAVKVPFVAADLVEQPPSVESHRVNQMPIILAA